MSRPLAALPKVGKFTPQNADEFGKQIALFEKALSVKTHNDDNEAPYVITARQKSTYNARPWEVVHADCTNNDVPVLLPDPTTCLNAWIGVKYHSGTAGNIVKVTAQNSSIDGSINNYGLYVVGHFVWFYASIDGWRISNSNARPSPIYVDDFGARGDSSHTSVVDGTDDTAAINKAIAFGIAFNSTVAFSPQKCYRIDGTLLCARSRGLVLDGSESAFHSDLGAWLKFTGTRKGNTPCIDAQSTLGFTMKSLNVDITTVSSSYAANDFNGGAAFANGAARVAGSYTQADIGKSAQDTDPDNKYANAAARIAVVTWIAGDVGKTALDQDTGFLWLILSVAAGVATWLQIPTPTRTNVYANAAARIAVTTWGPLDVGRIAQDTDTGYFWKLTAQVAGVATWVQIQRLRFQYSGTVYSSPWLPERLSIVEFGQQDFYTASPYPSAGSFARFAYCQFKDHTFATHRVFDQAIRLNMMILATVEDCSFISVRAGICGYDPYFMGGFSIKNRVHRGNFQHCDDYGIRDPNNGWTVSDSNFEPHSDGNADGVKFYFSGAHALDHHGNMHIDHSTGVCLELFGVSGANISGNTFAAGTGTTYAANITSCHGLNIVGNELGCPWNFSGASNSSTNIACIANNYLGAGDDVLNRSACLGLTYANTAFLFGGLQTSGTSFGTSAAGFGDNPKPTGAESFIAGGNANVASGTASLASGFTSTASGNNSQAGGVCGRAINVGQISLGGNSGGQTAVGASSWNEIALKYNGAITTGTTISFTDATGGNFALESLDCVRMRGEIVAIHDNATPTKRWGGTVRVLAQCISGTVTVLAATLQDVDDPDGTGCTATAVASGTNIQFQFTNNSGVNMRASCGVYWQRVVT